jgi:hypothetical protein
MQGFEREHINRRIQRQKTSSLYQAYLTFTEGEIEITYSVVYNRCFHQPIIMHCERKLMSNDHNSSKFSIQQMMVNFTTLEKNGFLISILQLSRD